jgi:sugar/nucleoside kinase (ribokinase family)
MKLEEIPDLPVKVIMISGIIAGEVDLPTLKALAQRAPLALDVQGFVRVPEGDDLVFKPWPEMAEGLRHITYLKVDRAEAEHLTGETDLQAAARKLASYGPKEIMLTQSSGPTVYAGGVFYQAPFTPRSLAGRTGRGDTCFSSYIGRRLSADAAEATRWAAAVTTLKQEKPGPWQGPAAEAEELMRRRLESA